jgi:hypothetical protein
MEPYQRATEEIRRQGELPLDLAKKAVSVGSAAATGLAGGAAIGRVLPFLNKYVPQDLAIKGLSKLDPRFGKFINKALSAGQSFDEIKDYIGGKAEEEEQKVAKESRNIIQQYSPELHQFIDQEVKKGNSPFEAGTRAQKDKRFSNIISKLSKDHKTPWSNIIESVFRNGSPDPKQEAVKKFKEHQKKQSTLERESNRFGEYYDVMNPPGSMPSRPPSAEQQAFTQPAQQQMQQQQPGQPGQGQQALMAMLQKINQRLGQGQ